MRVNDAVIGLVLVLFALAMILYTRTFPAMPGQNYGPALFPVLIGLGFIATGLVLIGQGWMRRQTQPLFFGAAWFRSPRHIAQFLAVPASLVFYILLVDWLGFALTALLLLVGLLVLFRGGRLLSSLVIALLVTFAVDYAFTKFLLVPLPLGLLQPILY